jgi:hypothetical protein
VSTKPGAGQIDMLMRETRNLKFLKYSKASDHKELEQALEKLVDAVETERREIGTNFSW